MAILDTKLEFSDDQDIASSTLSSGASVNSTNVINLGAGETDGFGTSITPNIGENGELEWTVAVTNEAFTGSGATVVCTLMTDTDSTVSDGTEVDRITIPATSAIGTRYSRKIPAGTISQYLGVVYTASGGDLTAGNVSSWISLDHEKTD